MLYVFPMCLWHVWRPHTLCPPSPQLIRCGTDEELVTIKREAAILFRMAHPNIVRYFSSFLHTDYAGDLNYCVVMENCTVGGLFFVS